MYFDDSHVYLIISPKKNALQCEKTICILTSTEDIFLHLQHCLACKEKEPADENTKTSNRWMLLWYKMTNEGLFELKWLQSPSSPSLLFHRWQN